MRLLAAVRALLAEQSLAGLSDAARLSALVLAAKSSHQTCRTAIRTRELGRWIGMSESTVAHDVLPRFRTSGSVKYRATTSESGQTTGLECVVMPLWRARRSGDATHPLALSKRELVTLLRLIEALFAPGWGAAATPAGLLAGQQGKGAATDRLALLLLVLQTGSDGRVRMVGGTVPKGRGRAAATVARLLGCSIAGGGKVLARLRAYGVVESSRAQADSGLLGKSRLVVPAVAAAHAKTLAAVPIAAGQRAADGKSGAVGLVNEPEGPSTVSSSLPNGTQEKAAGGGDALGVQRPAAAFGDLGKKRENDALGTPGEREVLCTATPEIAEHPGAAPLHTHHPSADDLCGDDADSGCFSGEAAGASGSRPVRAGAREKAPLQNLAMAAGSQTGERAGGPLRGEKHNLSSPHTEHDSQEASRQVLTAWAAKSGGPPTVWASLPKGLEAVLAPVETVWGRLNRMGARHRVTAAVHAELAQLRGTFGPQSAEKILTKRLRRRAAAQGHVAVSDPAGWLIGRALPRRSACYDARCDDGWRMDTGAECTACQLLHTDRRLLRRQVAAQVTDELATVPPQQRKKAFENRLREQFVLESSLRVLRNERAAVERSAREAAVAECRAQREAAEAARQMLPCAACGRAEAGGLCQVCTHAQATEGLIAEAVDTAVAAWAAPSDPVGQRQAEARAEAKIRAKVEQAMAECRAQGGYRETTSLIGKLTAESAAEKYRRSALALLARSPEAEVEAREAKAAELRRSHLYSSAEAARAAAKEAARAARWRTAQHLLNDRISRVRAQRPAPTAREEPDLYRMAAARVRAVMSRPRKEALV
ncbi:hypothetical protein AB0P36_17645 [Streptomyces flavidovirens]|uniref:hypothetical protein n=1 Tax=Streptomyces flavidovirens TaxID=67298 RepID=UPI003419A4B5